MLAAPAVARANEVFHWNAIAQAETVQTSTDGSWPGAGMAMVAGAMYDAVNAIDRGHEPYLVDFDEVGAPSWASMDAAAASAAYNVLLEITPVARHAQLLLMYNDTLALLGGGPDVDAGKAAGEAAAAAMSAFREQDGFLVPFTPTIGTGAGEWRPLGWPTPRFTTGPLGPNPAVPDQEPVSVPRRRAARAHERRVHRGLQRGEEARGAGQHVSHGRRDKVRGVLAVCPIALWNPLARNLAGQFGLGRADEARLYAQVNLAGADGATACWDSKYEYMFWRPRAAIQEAGTDDNPATIADSDWEPLFTPATDTSPLLNTPPFPPIRLAMAA